MTTSDTLKEKVCVCVFEVNGFILLKFVQTQTNMTSGSISPPCIIPLRVERTSKYLIDTNTLLEIRCQTNDVDVYYTLDGSKPDSFVTLAARRSTVQYKKPFYVPRELATQGKVAVKAIAVSR